MIKLENYKIIKKIASGGMGDVYLAEHTVLENKVAIKSLHSNLVNNEDFRKRFINEAKIQSNLSHPNIVRLIDFIIRKDGLFLIMEYIEGKQLNDYISEDTGPMPDQKLIPLFKEILSAINYAHSRNLIHRDIKPSNILITDNGNAKIIDFGIAKSSDEDKGLTKTGVQVGTISYMSPEQVNVEKLNNLTDIYSLGVILFQMAVGQAPYSLTVPSYQIQLSIVNEPLPNPKDIYPSVSDKLVSIIEKATQKNKKDRFQSCEEFIKSLESENVLESSKSIKKVNLIKIEKQKKIFKKVLVFSIILIGFLLSFYSVLKHPNLIFDYNKLIVNTENFDDLFNFNKDFYSRDLKFKINKPYNKLGIKLFIENELVSNDFFYSPNRIYFFDDAKLLNIDPKLDSLSQKIREIISKKIEKVQDVNLELLFNFYGGFEDEKIVKTISKSYLIKTMKFSPPKIISISGSNFSRKLLKLDKRRLISGLIKSPIFNYNDILLPTPISSKKSYVKVDVKTDKLWKESHITNSEMLLTINNSTNVNQNNDLTFSLSREFVTSNLATNKITPIYLNFENFDGFKFSILLGSLYIDSMGPELDVGYYVSKRNSSGIGKGRAEIAVQTPWRGWQKPVKVQLMGDIKRLYIDGKRFYFDPAKNPQNIYRKIEIESSIGFNRIKVIGYDSFENRSEAYWEYESVSAKD